MTKSTSTALALALSLLLQLITFRCYAETRALTARITDETAKLSTAFIESTTSRLKQFEAATGHQVAVLVIESLNGVEIDQYANRVFELTKLGSKTKNDGVLLVLAISDRKLRIEVGYGLEGVLMDARCSHIISSMKPALRLGSIEEAVQSGLDQILKLIETPETGKVMDEAIAQKRAMGPFDGDGAFAGVSTLTRILIGLGIYGFLSLFFIMGLFVPGFSSFFLYLFLIPFYGLFPSALLGWGVGKIGLITYLISWPLLKLMFWNKLATSTRSTLTGGWSSGDPSSDSSSFSSSSSSDSFSGDGGSSGGGGSSSDW